MKNNFAIYDSDCSNAISVSSLIDLFKDNHTTHIYFKSLSPNDNSKNQPYLAGHITDLSFIPTGKVAQSVSNSQKIITDKRKIKYTIDLDYSWLSPEGEIYKAPDSKLIYYPQYPEVRLSGFVAKCGFNMNGWMDPNKKGRSEGRVLFLGITKSKKILAYLAVPNSRVAREINDYPSIEISGVLRELKNKSETKIISSKELLLQELRRIHLSNWINGKRLDSRGNLNRYRAQNGGGYTLEAELGVTPNGYAGPDFMGWEIKQFGVRRCELIDSKALTLMTPEPDGGFYAQHGAEAFVRKYGYNNAKIIGRMDFTGRHFSGKQCEKSGLTILTKGYDHENHEITDAAGYVALMDKDGEAASLWSFSKLIEHWKKKHAKAAYIPSLSRKENDNSTSYRYCNNIRLFEGTTFIRLLHAFSESHVYYDPGIKLVNIDSNAETKRRSQFRIKSKLLKYLYEKQTDIDILSN